MFSTIYASERPTGVAALDCKLDAEDRLKELGVPATFLRLSALMTNISGARRPSGTARLLVQVARGLGLLEEPKQRDATVRLLT